MPDGTLAEWLATLPNVSNVRACSLNIGGTTYEAASYDALLEAPTGSRAAIENLAPTVERMLYVLGERPASHRTVYVIDGEDWFVAAWAEARVARSPETRQWHPWGEWFGMHKWDAPWPIDHQEDPYERVPVEVTYAS